jgi:ELWxxDGT repeat protein
MNNHNSLTSNCVQKLVIIDSRVSNYWELIAGVLPNTMVLVLDDNQDSIDQISNVLQSHNSIESLHLVAHGAPGQLFLGNNTLQAINLDYLSGKIAAWSQSLTQNAQILLYGCEAGVGNIGRELVEKLHSLTDRLVAAASKPIGLTAMGINWNLDSKSTNFQPQLAFKNSSLAGYTGVLADPFLVSDIQPGDFASSIGDTLFFSGSTSIFGVRDLWKTNGNSTSLVPGSSSTRINPQDILFSSPGNFLSVGNNIYFSAFVNNYGEELWKSDGTNTTLVKDISLGRTSSLPISLTQVGSNFFFDAYANIQNSSGRALFVSDGTADGTRAISTPLSDDAKNSTDLNGKLLFTGSSSTNGSSSSLGLWVSDGNSASLLKEINNSTSGLTLTRSGRYVYFTESFNGVKPDELWRSDGTSAGTTKITTDFPRLFLSSLTDVNGTLFGWSSNSSIFKVDADGNATKIDLNTTLIDQKSLINVNGTLFFAAKSSQSSSNVNPVMDLWKSDGTTLGTVKIKAGPQPDGNFLPSGLNFDSKNGEAAVLDGKLYFTSLSSTRNLWVSDGTAVGTKLLKSFNPRGDLFGIRFIGKTSDKLYFAADGDGKLGQELWAIQSDGTVTPEKPKDGVVTGGDPNGKLLNGDVESRRDRRKVGFEEIKNPQDGSGQTWVIIHGWNSSTGEANINELIQSIQGKVGANDRVLALNWQEAAANTSGLGDNLTSLAEGANARAATWITPVAEFAVRTLQERYGIDAAKASTSLNLVGHSLGSLLSSDIGRIYRDGGILVNPFPASPETANTAVAANGGGVRTITALDPASALNLPLSGFTYDLDGRVSGIQAPQNFADTSVFSRSYNGAKSVAGNRDLAVTADEAIEMDFGNTLLDADEHGRVIQSFAKVFGQSELIGDLLGVQAYQSISTLPINDFDILSNRPVGTSGFRGILNIEKSDSDADVNNRANLLIGQATTGSGNNIAIGSAQDDDIQGSDSSSEVEGAGDRRYNGIGNDKLFGADGNDTVRGKSGNDMLIGGAGNDVLLGYGGVGTTPNTDDDLLYGGLGKDVLSGGYGSDIFVFKAGDGSTNLNNADTITDFQLGIDKIGLIGLVASQITIRAVGGIATISLGNELLAKIKGQGVSAAKLQSSDIFTVVSPDIFQVN